jgi:LPXTG-motif cell wall-anchored protein
MKKLILAVSVPLTFILSAPAFADYPPGAPTTAPPGAVCEAYSGTCANTESTSVRPAVSPADIPRTGNSTTSLVLFGSGLMVVGAAAVVASRRA